MKKRPLRRSIPDPLIAIPHMNQTDGVKNRLKTKGSQSFETLPAEARFSHRSQAYQFKDLLAMKKDSRKQSSSGVAEKGDVSTRPCITDNVTMHFGRVVWSYCLQFSVDYLV